MVDLSRDVTDVTEFDQLREIEVPTDGFISSSDAFVSWPDYSGSAIDVPVAALDAPTELQAPVTDFGAITGSEVSVIDSYTPDIVGPDLELTKIVDELLTTPHSASLGSFPTSRPMRQVKPKLADVDDPDDEYIQLDTCDAVRDDSFSRVGRRCADMESIPGLLGTGKGRRLKGGITVDSRVLHRHSADWPCLECRNWPGACQPSQPTYERGEWHQDLRTWRQAALVPHSRRSKARLEDACHRCEEST